MFIQILCLALSVQAMPRGVVGQESPSLQGVAWVHTIDDVTPTIEIGKVNYLFFFQSWCPGCHSHGFPTLQAMHEKFLHDVNFIAVQTVFEGFSTNTKERALENVQSFGLDLPVGHDGTAQMPSRLLRKFRGGGTPWTIIIDKQGVVRFNGFRLQQKQGEEMLAMLINEPAYEILPKERGGQELVGDKLKKPAFGEFSAPLTLYRWWTDTCPHCEASLPALDSLREKYEDRGLKVVGVYHPKPPSKTISEKEIFEGAAFRQFKGEVVIDQDWSQLQSWWLGTGERNATSVSILVDDEGIVRFVHPGPVLFPSEEKQFAQENSDFELLDLAIHQLLPKKEPTVNVYNNPCNNVLGSPLDMGTFDGQVTLIVNLASKCGYTPQYEDLQSLHERYKDRGFSVVGFPCNDFGGQEPGDAATITACASGYGATFPIMEKVHVVDNDEQCAIYQDLQKATGVLPKWNFCKYLVDQHGTPVAFFGSSVEPLSAELTDRVDELLTLTH